MTEPRGILARLDDVLRFAGRGLIVLGLIAVAAPIFSGKVLTIVLGFVLLLAGALASAFGLRLREKEKGNALLYAGISAALVGLVLVLRPSAGLSAVGWILVPYLLISGLSEATLAMRLRPEAGWSETLGSALVSLLAGLVLLLGWPISGARAIGLLVGAKLISTGYAVIRVHQNLEVAGRAMRNVGDKFRSLKAE